MRICFVANVNSKTSLNWISYFLSKEKKKQYEVHVISPYPPIDSTKLDGAQMHVISLIGREARSVKDIISSTTNTKSLFSKTWAKMKTKGLLFAGMLARTWWSQVSLLMLKKHIRHVIQEIQPDLVHALRLFQEGEMAGLAGWHPLIISLWGQDLIIEARLSPLHGWLARNALNKADAVTADNKRDLELAFEWGRRAGTPGELFLASGGIRPDLFHPSEPDPTMLQDFNLETDSIVILSPRGMGPGYMRLKTLFQAIPKVVRVYPKARFVQFEIPNQAIAENYGLSPESMPFIRLVKRSSQGVLAELMRRSTLMVSPAVKDGTPNSFFECMACGAVPIVPTISPYPEWIKNAENGMFFDPYDPDDLAKAIIQALNSPQFLRKARDINLELVNNWASRDIAMRRVEEMYKAVVSVTK